MESFLAGAAGGVSGLLVGHPMEVMKVQLQLAPTGHATLAARAMFSNGVQQGLFQGMAMPMVSFTAINSVFFGVYGHTFALLQKLRSERHHGNVALAGMAGGAAQLPLVAPVELIKTAMQAQLSRARCTSELHRGPLACASAIVRREGTAGLTRGFAVTFLRDVPSYGLYMLTYDWLYSRLGHMTGETAATMLAGGLAGSISWLSVLPIDNVKSNMQAEAGSGQLGTSASSRSALSVARQVLREYGIAGFYRGSFIVIVRSFPVNAVTFLVWKRTSHYLGVDGDRGHSD